MTNLNYNVHAYIPSLDYAENRTENNIDDALAHVRRMVKSVLEDCDVAITDNLFRTYPINISLSLGTPGPQADSVVVEGAEED